MKIITVIARFLLGLIFLTFGLNGFLHFLPTSLPSGTAGQFNLTHSPVLGAFLARNQSFLRQPINRHADGTGGKPDLGADGVDREGSFVEEGFEDAKIRVAQLCLLDAPGRVRNERLKGFHENEPDMHAGGVLPSSGSSPIHFLS